MSKMLEQAIIDAEALREAALKNAKNAIIEHYAGDIKNAVETILEQDELGGEELGTDLGADLDAELSVDDTSGEAVVSQVPSAATKEEGDVITIDLSQLEEMMEAEIEEEGDLKAEELLDREEIAEEVVEEDPEIELDEEVLSEILDEEKASTEDAVEESETETVTEENEEELEETTQASDDTATSADEQVAASEEVIKENKTLLTSINKNNKQIKRLKEQNNKYRTLVANLKNKLNEVNVSNAKLLYTNRVLNSVSLNERQKDRIVESISKADSVEEAKTIFDTLQSAVGSVSVEKTPKSLNEVVRKRSSAFLPRKEEKKSDPIADRMKILAGIKQN
jgi:hypothetical protein